MVASFHVARAAAELILHRDKATVLGGEGSLKKKRCICNPVPDKNCENRYPIPDSYPLMDNQFLRQSLSSFIPFMICD